MTIIHRVANPLTGKPEYFTDDEVGALVKLAQNRTELLVREANRFSMAKVVVDGGNTIWSAADTATDSEVGEYRVFNHLTGVHEEFSLLSLAVARMDELKNEFLASVGLDAPVVVDAIPLPPQPPQAERDKKNEDGSV